MSHHYHNIIYVNTDLSPNVLAALQRQLMITDTMTGTEFDARVAADPNYPTIAHQEKFHLLVIRPLTDLTNRNLADLVIFVKGGLASAEDCKSGRPRFTLPVDRMTLHEISKRFPYIPYFPCDGYGIQNNILYPLYGPLVPDRDCEVLAPFGNDDDDDDEGDDNDWPWDLEREEDV
jgi:hypothetical protein